LPHARPQPTARMILSPPSDPRYYPAREIGYAGARGIFGRLPPAVWEGENEKAKGNANRIGLLGEYVPPPFL